MGRCDGTTGPQAEMSELLVESSWAGWALPPLRVLSGPLAEGYPAWWLQTSFVTAQDSGQVSWEQEVEVGWFLETWA